MAEYTGGCLCGAVRYGTSAEPARVGLCHCLDCRKSSGSIVAIFAAFPAGQVALSGETRLAPAGRAPGRRFCPRCGSPVYSHDEGSDEIEIHAGTLDEPGRLAPTYELWTIRREPLWLPEMPHLVRYERDRTGPARREP